MANWAGYNYATVSANNAGLLIAACGITAAGAQTPPVPAGDYLKRLVVSGDATGTFDIYDGLSTAGSHLLSWSKANTPWYVVHFDIKLKVGLFVVLAGATSPFYTVVWG